MKARIAILSVHTSPLAPLGRRETGGMNVYIRELATDLGKQGYEIDIFTRRDDVATPAIVQMTDNVRAVHIDCGPAGYLEKELIHQHLGEFEAGVEAFAAGRRYDIVHSHYWLSGEVGMRLAERWRVPHVTMFHTLAEVKKRARLRQNEPDERAVAEHRIAASATRIVVASEHERNLLVRLYDANPERVVIAPLGVDLDLFRPLDRSAARRTLGLPDGPIILFVGRIEPLKGLDLLVEAVGQLDEPPTLLVIGGDERSGGLVSQISARATALGVESEVRFLGSVQHDRLPLYYSAADVCVVPSYYESFGLVAVEAMACGTPVVASRVGGLTSTVRDGVTGYLIPWRCPEPYADMLDTLLANDELRANLGLAAREVAGEFGWDRVGATMAALYEELIERQSAAPVPA
ncbi:MAG: glycosyltransferase [Dehalococcoidia bacterium]|nr:glycosyltransferase [Dehalococcoidia bacterium]